MYSAFCREHVTIEGCDCPLSLLSGSLDLPSNFLEDSDKDFDTPPSTPPEGQVPIGHSTGD